MIGSSRHRMGLGGIALLAALAITTGCGLMGGRPQTYHELADGVVSAFADNSYPELRDLVVTNDEMRQMGLPPEGDADGHFATAENAVLECWPKVRDASLNDGVDWKDAQMTSAIPLLAHDKFKEKVDVKVIVTSMNQNYELLIKNAQMAADGMVLTDKIEWVGKQ